MQTPHNPNATHFLFALTPTLPSVFFGFIFMWQQGASLTNVSFVFLMILFSAASGYFVWAWHTGELARQAHYHQKKYSDGVQMLMSYTVELERLLLTVEPKLVEQVTAARELTEQEISALIHRFSSMNEGLKQIFDFADQAAESQGPENFDYLKNSAGGIRNEIEAVLQALQFQDRVSQILVLVQANLATLRETLEQIQQQGSERHEKMIDVEEIVKHIQTQYETVKHSNNRSTSKQTADELTFF